MSNHSRTDGRSRGRRGGCPVCGKLAGLAASPFCSQGCRDRDLLQWLGGGYRVPGPVIETDTEE